MAQVIRHDGRVDVEQKTHLATSLLASPSRTKTANWSIHSPVSATTAEGHSTRSKDDSPISSHDSRDRVISEASSLEDGSDITEDVEARDASLAKQIDFGCTDCESKASPNWAGFFVNAPMFCGYATLFGLQHEVKAKLGFSDMDVGQSRTFGIAVSFLYIFNMIFRFSHNIVFGCISPRHRTCIAMLSMMASMLTIAIPIFLLESDSLMWVVIAYALGGVAMGTFEANFLCCLTPLGNATKHIAITAIPLGVTIVLVGGFFAMAPPVNVPPIAIYLAVAFSVLCGMILFATCILHSGVHERWHLIAEARQWRQWFPLIWHLPIASAVDMFVLTAVSPGVALYIWDSKFVHVLPGVFLPTDTFFAYFNIFGMVGGVCGRVLSYRLRPRHPILYAGLSVVGAMLVLLKIPAIAPLGTFLALMGDGLIYGTITRRIDATVPKQFNLIALSFWLFVGDFGGVTGSNLISYLRIWVVGFH